MAYNGAQCILWGLWLRDKHAGVMRVHLENLLHTCYGLQRQVIQGYRMIQDDTGIQGYRDTGVQGYRDTGIQEYRDTAIQGYRDIGVQ